MSEPLTPEMVEQLDDITTKTKDPCKIIWFIGVVLPLLISGGFPGYAVVHVSIFATYIIGDLIAIPFSYVFSKSLNQPVEAGAK